MCGCQEIITLYSSSDYSEVGDATQRPFVTSLRSYSKVYNTIRGSIYTSQVQLYMYGMYETWNPLFSHFCWFWVRTGRGLGLEKKLKLPHWRFSTMERLLFLRHHHIRFLFLFLFLPKSLEYLVNEWNCAFRHKILWNLLRKLRSINLLNPPNLDRLHSIS